MFSAKVWCPKKRRFRRRCHPLFFFCLAVHQCTFGQMFRACSISICLFEFCACVLCLNRSVVLSLVCLSSSCQRIVCCFCPPHQLAFGSGQRFCRWFENLEIQHRFFVANTNTSFLKLMQWTGSNSWKESLTCCFGFIIMLTIKHSCIPLEPSYMLLDDESTLMILLNCIRNLANFYSFYVFVVWVVN